MSEEEQEKFEDYLDLERYIEQLRMQRSAHLPANLTSQQKRIYGMAALFHTATPRVADPSPEFSARLYQHLREQMRDDGKGQGTPGARQGAVGTAPALPLQSPAPTVPFQPLHETTRLQENQVSQRTHIRPTHPESTDMQRPQKREGGKGANPFRRRALFRGGTIAASLVAGAAIGAAIEQSLQPKPDLNPTIHGAEWHRVTSVEQLGESPIAFNTNTITGYVIRHTESQNGATSPSTEQIIAFSAACTHLGCIVQWEESTRQFPCPCHGRTFDTQGGPVYKDKSQPQYMSLPRLEIKVENGNIYVKVPVL